MEQIKDLMKNIICCVSAQSTNLEHADAKEMSEAMDMIKDLAMAEYYCTITKAMEDPANEYGEDYDENGRIKKGYRPMVRSTMRRGYDDMYMGYDNMGNSTHYMPYTDMDNMGRMNNSQYDRARRGYEDHKDINSLNKIFDIIEQDMKELKPSMSMSDKQTAHQRLTTLANMLNV